MDLNILQKQDSNHCCPTQDLESIGRGADKSLHPQVLFENLKKYLDLPSVLVNGRDGGGSKLQMIGQKDDQFFFFSIPNLDPPQLIRTVSLSIKTRESNNLVFQDVVIPRHPKPLDHPVAGLLFQPGHKIHPVFGPVAKKLIFCRSPGKSKLAQDVDLMTPVLSDMGILRKIAFMTQEQMQFYYPLGLAKLRPVKKTGT